MATRKMTQNVALETAVAVPIGKVPAGKVKADKIEAVSLSLVNTTSFENSRSGNWAVSTKADETVNELDDLVKSIGAKGQTTAVFVRNAKGANAKKQPYELIAGFRRAKALQVIQGLNPGADVTIKIINKGDIDDYTARALNVEENTARDDLAAPDLAWAIHDLSKQAQAAGLALSDVKLAEDQGISQAYGNRLLRIMRNVSPKLTAAWRKDSIALSVPEMDSLCDLKDPAEQKAQYDKLLGKRQEASETGSARGPGAWVETAKKSAISLGDWLSVAEENGWIKLESLEFNGDLVRSFNAAGLIKFGKNPSDAQINKVAAALNAAYDASPDKRAKAAAEAEAKAAEQAAKAEAKAGKAEPAADKPKVKRRAAAAAAN